MAFILLVKQFLSRQRTLDHVEELSLLRLRRNRRAVSSMLGAVFFVIIIFTGLNLMLYNLAQNWQLESTLANIESSSHDKLAEMLQVLAIKMSSCSGTTCALNVTIFNAGGRTIRIVRMWITDQTGPQTGWQHYSLDVNYMIGPALIETNIGSTLGSFQSTSTLSISLVSDRGNLFTSRYTPNTSTFATAMGSGWLTMDWLSYQYSFYTGSGSEQGPYPAWCISGFAGGGNTRYQFYASVINHWDRDVTLLSYSYLVLYKTSGSAQSFYIMSPTSTAKNPVSYSTPITILANPQDQQTGGTLKTLNFFASSAGDNQQSNNAMNGGSFAVFVILFYQDSSGATLSQTIPFEASEVTGDSTC